MTGAAERTTTITDELSLPAKARCTMSRAATDSLPVSSQPAPDRACSTWGANTPSAMTAAAHRIATMPKWVADQRPRRPSGP